MGCRYHASPPLWRREGSRVCRSDSASSFSFKPAPAGGRTPGTGAHRHRGGPRGSADMAAAGNGPRWAGTRGREWCTLSGEHRADLTPTEALQSGPRSPWLENVLFGLEACPGDSLSCNTTSSNEPRGALPLSLQLFLLGG